MYMFERRITLEDRPILDAYLEGFDYKASGLTFTSLYMWRDINHFSWEIFGDYLCIAGISHLELENEEAFLFPPLTRDGTYEPAKLRETILWAKEAFEAKGQKFQVRLMPFHMVELLRHAFSREMRFVDDRPNYDYVYLKKDLVELAGRTYHSKRNHLNHFKEHYNYEYGTLAPEDTEEVMAFIRDFNDRKDLPPYDRELLRMEETAMEDVLRNLDRVGYLTGAIRVDGALIAFCIGGRLGKKSVTVHVEKADTRYRGAYQAINNEFCLHLPPTVKYVNREEDMGLPGLRKAKLSYHPYKLIESYFAYFPKEIEG